MNKFLKKIEDLVLSHKLASIKFLFFVTIFFSSIQSLSSEIVAIKIPGGTVLDNFDNKFDLSSGLPEGVNPEDVEELNIHNNLPGYSNPAPNMGDILNGIEKFTSLKSLIISSSYVCYAPLFICKAMWVATQNDIDRITKLSSLKSLIIHGNFVLIKSFDFQKMSQLEKLTIDPVTYSGQIYDFHNTDDEEISSLKELNVNGLYTAEFLEQFPNLEILNVLSFKSTSLLPSISKLNHLKKLNINGLSMLDDSSMEMLGSMPSLETVTFNGSKISNIEAIKYMNQIKNLYINSEIDDELLNYITLPQLISLSLSSGKGVDLASFAPNLTYLRAKLSGKDVINLKKLPNLESVDLSKSSIGKGAITSLSKLEAIRHLSLNYTKVSGANWPVLLNNKQLSSLSLIGCELNRSDLINLQNLKHLKVLNLASNNTVSIRDIDRQELQEALPDCEIRW